MDQKLKRRLKAVMARPANQVCCDCNDKKPTWASLIVAPPDAIHSKEAIGAFCCFHCSGAHRRLGVHICFVRSLTLDEWKESEVITMERGGNMRVNAAFEARLDDLGAKPNKDSCLETRDRFIKAKYSERRFFDPKTYTSGVVPKDAYSIPTASELGYGYPDETQQRLGGRRRVMKRRSSLPTSPTPTSRNSSTAAAFDVFAGLSKEDFFSASKVNMLLGEARHSSKELLNGSAMDLFVSQHNMEAMGNMFEDDAAELDWTKGIEVQSRRRVDPLLGSGQRPDTFEQLRGENDLHHRPLSSRSSRRTRGSKSPTAISEHSTKSTGPCSDTKSISSRSGSSNRRPKSSKSPIHGIDHRDVGSGRSKTLNDSDLRKRRENPSMRRGHSPSEFDDEYDIDIKEGPTRRPRSLRSYSTDSSERPRSSRVSSKSPVFKLDRKRAPRSSKDEHRGASKSPAPDSSDGNGRRPHSYRRVAANSLGTAGTSNIEGRRRSSKSKSPGHGSFSDDDDSRVSGTSDTRPSSFRSRNPPSRTSSGDDISTSTGGSRNRSRHANGLDTASEHVSSAIQPSSFRLHHAPRRTASGDDIGTTSRGERRRNTRDPNGLDTRSEHISTRPSRPLSSNNLETLIRDSQPISAVNDGQSIVSRRSDRSNNLRGSSRQRRPASSASSLDSRSEHNPRIVLGSKPGQKVARENARRPCISRSNSSNNLSKRPSSSTNLSELTDKVSKGLMAAAQSASVEKHKKLLSLAGLDDLTGATHSLSGSDHSMTKSELKIP